MQQDLHKGYGSREAGSHRLKWWICFSGVLHLALILPLLAAPPSTARRNSAVPVYTVDLVAGDGPAPLEPGAAPKPEPPRKQEAREPVLETVAVEAPGKVQPPPKAEAPAKKPPPEKKAAKAKEPRKAKKVKKAEKVAKPKKAEKAKKVAKPKKPKKVEKPKKAAKSGKLAEPGKVTKRKAAKPGKEKAAARKDAAKPKKVAKAKKAKKAAEPKKPAKAKKAAEPKRSDGGDSKLARRLKQRRIDAAVATARERARMRRETGGARSDGGRGSGAGTGNGVGGLVRGMEFVAYHNRMLGQVKENWTWPRNWLSRPGELEVTVRFGVRVDGEIVGVELLRRSGDASFDESVVRAVRRASPLPPPPRSDARKFRQVDLTFRPGDLDGQGPSG